MKEAIRTEAAPDAVGAYSQALRVGDWVHCSGQIGLDPATGELVSGGVRAEARRVLENLEAVLAAAGATFADVVRATIYLTNIDDFAVVNEEYGARFEAPFPARAAVGVAALPKGASIEIDAIAHVSSEGGAGPEV